ncbi:DUF4129 domain-containing protein [Mycobacterium sp. GA-2829]|uniref:DUF4129 domain-containing protein n=1 Tax=Mycobacterium sp. GA-2829 TaxID=1772283 RepID=UPI00073FB7D9|nr:DUF4129 domain-containing protein [Mycobacterium sp. GA-2829]KUI25974.1 hypothetical protein AU194_06740 [Mycobacterium sp. GA-2829]
MPGADKATARAVTVIVLLLLAGVALRGHLPDAEPTADEPAEPGPGPLIAVLMMLALSMAVIAVSVISQSRHPRARPDPAGELRSDRGADGRRWTWRMVLVLAAALLLWLVIVLALMRVSGWLDLAVDQPDPPPPPDPSPNADSEPPAEPPPAPGPAPVLLYFACAAALFVLLGAFAAARRRARPRPVSVKPESAYEGAPPESRTQTLARAAERGLVEIGDLSREPREAIIACYAAMERELGKSPGAIPQDSDTPTEVLGRAVDLRLLRGDSAGELVDLFEEARFSTHVMGEDHREAAIRVLRMVLRELQESA